jgi:aminodeoxyfutalosine synthase
MIQAPKPNTPGDQSKAHPRLTRSEAVALWNLPLHTLGGMADEIKRARFGDRVTYIRNYYLNFTNICKYACKYCGFRRNKRSPDAYTLSIEQICTKLKNAPEKIREVWFSSGLNADLPFRYYTDLLRAVKQVLPSAMVKAFTAVEIDFFAQRFEMPHAAVLDTLIEAGLDRIPGGGAEIFSPHIRKQIDIKTSAEDYLTIHRLCHERGIPTSMTMLFGHIESREDRIDHLLQIRDFQDSSGGVQAVIPLAFQDSNNPLAKRGVKGPGPIEILRTLAITRILLDNVDHIQSFWIDNGPEVTQISLHYGVDDINGTMIEETIAHESGASTKTYETKDTLVSWIKQSGLQPAERDCRFSISSSF